MGKLLCIQLRQNAFQRCSDLAWARMVSAQQGSLSDEQPNLLISETAAFTCGEQTNAAALPLTVANQIKEPGPVEEE